MGSRALVAHLAAVLVFAVAARGEEGNEVALDLYRGYVVVVRGSIGSLQNLNFVVDTGAVPTVVDRRIARKHRLRGGVERLSVFTGNVEAERVILPDIRVGKCRADSLAVLVRDLSFIKDALGVRVDALVGLDFLGRSDFTLDYAAKKMIFGPVDRSVPAASFVPGHPYAVVKLQTETRPLYLMVDTGTKDLILFEGRVRGWLQPARVGASKAASNMGGEVALHQVLLDGLRLGNVTLPTQTAFITDTGDGKGPGFDGLLGVATLQAKRIGFDFRRSLIAWESALDDAE